MGCWNKTCGLSNLPIMCGEDTYVFVLQRENEIENHCYATHLYRPLLLPFVSTYNDYGGGENSRGAAFPIVMKGIQDCLIEVEQGKNPYHDIPVKRDAWNEDLFFEAVHEHRLKISRGGSFDLTYVMMRKDIVDNLFDTYEFEEWVGEIRGNTGYNNCYVRYRMPDVIADIDSFFDAVIRIQGEEKRVWLDLSRLAMTCQTDGENLAAKWCSSDIGYRYCNLVLLNEMIPEMVLAGRRDEARELLIEHLRARFLDTFMMITRKSWIPGGHEGSQGQEFDGYRALIASMNRVMDQRDARYAAEDGDGE